MGSSDYKINPWLSWNQQFMIVIELKYMVVMVTKYPYGKNFVTVFHHIIFNFFSCQSEDMKISKVSNCRIAPPLPQAIALKMKLKLKG